MCVPLWWPLMVSLVGQAPDDPAARLDYMRKSVSEYELSPADGPGASFRLKTDPVLRFRNTVGDSQDGTVFLWVEAHERPVAAVQVFYTRRRGWTHELCSFSTAPIVAKSGTVPVWNPAIGGVVFKPVPGAPKPADTAEKRLRQMREITRDFTAEDQFRNASWQSLRMLPKPFARYGEEGTELIDGALFAYVLTTDPEVYVLLEARKTVGGSEWQFAFAPSTIYPVRGSWKGTEVWSLPFRFALNKATDPFFYRRITIED